MTDNGPSIAGGRVTGAFTYGSRGSQGWGVLELVGDVTPADADVGRHHIARLLGDRTADGERHRRLVWGGDPRDPRHFLIHTVAAGLDASNRPDNNFSHALVVRAGASGVDARPSQYWNGADWLCPYGASQVAAVDLRRSAVVGPAQVALTPEQVAARPEALTRLGSLLGLLEVAGRTGSPLLLGTSNPDLGALYLDLAMGLMPPELLWSMTFEITTQDLAPETDAGGLRVRLGRCGEQAPPGVVQLERLATTLPTAVACASCSLLEETWASVAAAAIQDCASAAPDCPAAETAESLRRVQAAVRSVPRGPAPLADRLWDVFAAAQGPWLAPGSAFAAAAARLPRARHEPLPSWRARRAAIAGAPAISPAGLAGYLAQPPQLIGRNAIASVLDHLATADPSPETAETAGRLLHWMRAGDGRLPDRLVVAGDWARILGLHAHLGRPDAAASAKLEAFDCFAITPVGGNGSRRCLDLLDARLAAGAADITRSAVVVAVAEGATVPCVSRWSAADWDQILRRPALGRDWIAPLLVPEVCLAFVAACGPNGAAGLGQDLGRRRLGDSATVAGALLLRARADCDPTERSALDDTLRRIANQPRLGPTLRAMVPVAGPSDVPRPPAPVYAADAGHQGSAAVGNPSAADRVFGERGR